MNKFFYALLFSLCFAITPCESDENETESIDSFEEAKKVLRDKIYPQRQVSIYCGCTYNKVEVERDYEKEKAAAYENHLLYNWDSPVGFTFPSLEDWQKQPKRYQLVPDHKSCGFEPKGTGVRANRIEWEHVMPASHIGEKISAWTEGHPDCVTKYREVRFCERTSTGEIQCTTKIYQPSTYKGRSCASKVSPQFRRMEGDLHNLYPSVGEVNGFRSNLPFGIIDGETQEFGQCDFEYNREMAEPAANVRGEIARTYFYMAEAYPTFISLDNTTRQLMLDWGKSDPVNEWECKRNRLIATLQGNSNPFVDQACIEAGFLNGQDSDL